jgi:uncharacterized protein
MAEKDVAKSGETTDGVANESGEAAEAELDGGEEKAYSLKPIDAFVFARQGKEASGTVVMTRLLRFLEELPEQHDDEQGDVTWSVRGRMDNAGQLFLNLHVTATPTLICQRCLASFAFPIDSHSVMQLVKSEADLDNDILVDEPDDEEFVADLPEKVVGSHRFDLLTQIEDELLLSIPYVPKHDICPGARSEPGAETPPEAEAETSLKRPSPFAVLEKLKQKV